MMVMMMAMMSSTRCTGSCIIGLFNLRPVSAKHRYYFESVFSRSFEGLANKKDVLIAISTSGNSKNILKVLKISKKKNIMSIALLGNSGGKAVKNCNYSVIVDSKNTARIQEAHIFLGHYILDKVEEALIYRNR